MKLNPIISTLIISDVFIFTGFGLVQPILAIYLNNNIAGGTIFTAGLASTIFLITKSLVQLPFSHHVDTHDDQNDRKWLIIGTLILGVVPFLYLFAQHISIIFLAQFFYGVGAGLAYPTWVGLWSTHIDRGQESFEWSFYNSVISIATAIAASIGGGLAYIYGFHLTLIYSGCFTLIGAIALFQLSIIKTHKKMLRSKIKMPFHHQETEYTCGPASLKMILKYFEILKTEQELAKEIKTNAKIGSLHSRMIEASTKAGLFCYVNDDSTMHEIKMFIYKKLPVIVHYIEPSDNTGHYATIIGFRNTSLTLNDPWNGKNFILSMSDFIKRWHDEENSFSHWIMVLSKKDLHLGKQYRPNKK